MNICIPVSRGTQIPFTVYYSFADVSRNVCRCPRYRVYKCLTHIFRSVSGRNCGGSWTRTLSPLYAAVRDNPQREIHEVSGDVIPINMVKGIGHLRDPRLNKVLLCLPAQEHIAHSIIHVYACGGTSTIIWCMHISVITGLSVHSERENSSGNTRPATA